MNQIVWSNLAYDSYTEIRNFLTNNYSLDTAISFDEDVDIILSRIENFGELCPKYERRPSFRRCVVNKYISMLYTIRSKSITIVTFFDNRGFHPY